jgi:hypothetical protein
MTAGRRCTNLRRSGGSFLALTLSSRLFPLANVAPRGFNRFLGGNQDGSVGGSMKSAITIWAATASWWFPVRYVSMQKNGKGWVMTTDQSGSNSPPGPYLLLRHSKAPNSLKRCQNLEARHDTQSNTYCWRARFCSRSLPTSLSSIRTSEDKALLKSSKYCGIA